MKEKAHLLSLVEYFPFLDAGILQDRLVWSIRLRWLAVFGYFFATLIAHYLFDLNLPYVQIWFTLALLLLINLGYFALQRFVRKLSFEMELSLLSVHIVVDLLFLSVLLHFSGGIENPIYFFYLFHVVLSSIVFPPALTPVINIICLLKSILTGVGFSIAGWANPSSLIRLDLLGKTNSYSLALAKLTRAW